MGTISEEYLFCYNKNFEAVFLLNLINDKISLNLLVDSQILIIMCLTRDCDDSILEAELMMQPIVYLVL